MKMLNKGLIVLLVLCMACAAFAGCNNTPSNPGVTPGGKPTGTTQGAPQTEAPVTEYGIYSTESPVLTLEQLFEEDIAQSAASFNTGSSYSEEKLTHVFKITDYIANYEKYVEEYEVQDQLDQIYAETGFTLDMDFAADMMKHYIDATGETLDFTESMPDLLKSAKVSGAQSTGISAAMVAAENLVKDGQSGIAINQTAYMKFTSLKPSDGPAYYALGNFYTMADLADVQRNGDTFSATVHFRIVDFYDWSPHDQSPLFTDVLNRLDDTYRTLVGEMVDMPTLEGFCQADLSQLHTQGWAQNYLSFGAITYTITWTAGQTFDQATILTVNGQAQ